MSNFFQKIPHLFLIFLICITQYGCEASSKPPDSVVKEALDLKIQLTHRSLDEFLGLEQETAEIENIKVKSSNYVKYGEADIVSVSGYFDGKFPGFSKDIHSPFSLLLERGEKGQSWRLVEEASFENSLPNELNTYPLPIKY